METPTASLKQVRAAQLRARLLRRATSQLAFGTLFLIGALSFALGPESTAPSSKIWMILLTVVSSLDIAIGLRLLVRARRYPQHLWPIATFAWAILMATLLRYLVAAD